MTLGSDATGDTYYRSSGATLTRLGVGSDGQILTVSGGLPSWATSLKEDLSNKATDFTVLNNTLYPTTLATSNYVGQLINGLNWKFSVTCSTAVALPTCTLDGTGLIITASSNGALPLIDGYDTTFYDGISVRILVKNEANQFKNGIYTITQQGSAGTPFILTRTSDCDTNLEIATATVYVRNGNTERNRVYTLIYGGGNYSAPIGTTSIQATLVNSANTYTNGSGLTLTGNVFSIANGAITNVMLAGSIDLTTKVTGVLPSANGGTGVNNGSSTITLGGNLITSGAFSTTLTSTATTNVTLPTSGTLYGTATGSITSAQLATSLTDETGSGSNVFATSPTLVTPILGVATITSINKVTITQPTTSATLTLIDGSSLITSGAFAITLTSTNTTNVTLPTTGTLATLAGTETLTNKRITPRTGTTTSSATPTINTDVTDYYSITALAVNITNITMSGTPTDGQKIWISITGTAARAITWGASFEASTIALPTTTVTTARLDVGFIWNTVTSKWRCVGTC
jgi:hypothetical protein